MVIQNVGILLHHYTVS